MRRCKLKVSYDDGTEAAIAVCQCTMFTWFRNQYNTVQAHFRVVCCSRRISGQRPVAGSRREHSQAVIISD
jgi:hypothetical protein